MDRPLPGHNQVSSFGRAAQDLGLAALIGGNLFARTALHPALAELADKRERGKLLNHTWRRYGTVNGVALTALSVGWLGARCSWAAPALLSRRGRRIAVAKDVAVGVVAVSGLASAAVGVRFAATVPDGAVPMKTGDTPSKRAPEEAKRLKRAMNALASVHLGAAVAAASLGAALDQANLAPPPARRLLGRVS